MELGKASVEESVELGCLVAQRAKVRNDPRVLLKEHGQHLVTNPSSLENALVIRGVVDEWKRPLDCIRPHFGTRAIEQRADDPVGSSGFDPS
jgi:hypothetical protein